MNPNPIFLSATDIVRQIRAGTLTACEVVEACLEQIERCDPMLHAWIHVDRASALRQASEVDARNRAGNPVGALCGVPVGVKDIFNTMDFPTQMGSPIWKDFTPGNDARVVHSLRMADAVIPGKTVTAEFAVHTPGPTRNPHNTDYMAGTSSTGSAVSVAACMLPLAIGTQTAGSTIRPASYCGIYGYKPSFGLVPRTGMLKTTDSLDTVGFFARTVEDLVLLFDVTRVHGPDYPISHAALHDTKRQSRSGDRWRVALLRGPKWSSAETYAQDALLEFARALGQQGDVIVDEPKFPGSLNEVHDIHSIIYDRTLAYYFRAEFQKHTLISPVMYEIIARGNRITLEQYKVALERQNQISHEVDQFLGEYYDVILNLSTGGEALKGLQSPDRPDHCLIWTLCGLPAVNLPVFKGPNGLPFGAQIVARRYSDYGLLSFARMLEERGVTPPVPYPVPTCVRQKSVTR